MDATYVTTSVSEYCMLVFCTCNGSVRVRGRADGAARTGVAKCSKTMPKRLNL